VIDSRGAADQPVRLAARTRSTVLAQAGIIAAGACLLTLEFALTFGWSGCQAPIEGHQGAETGKTST